MHIFHQTNSFLDDEIDEHEYRLKEEDSEWNVSISVKEQTKQKAKAKILESLDGLEYFIKRVRNFCKNKMKDD